MTTPTTKSDWMDSMVAKRAARGYTEEENAAYRLDLEARFARFTDEEFAEQLAARSR